MYSEEQFGDVFITVKGIWSQVILYEVPLLALISESYYKFVDLNWDHDLGCQAQQIRSKALLLLKNGCIFSEFGTRRRRSFEIHDLIVGELASLARNDYKLAKSLISANNAGFSLPLSEPTNETIENSDKNDAHLKYTKDIDHISAEFLQFGKIVGTSNVFLAKKYNIMPSGTVGHEWTMGTAAIEQTFNTGNKIAMYKWAATFKQHLSIALTDTFGIKSFFNNFDYYLSNTFNGIRHDSGDPVVLLDMAIAHYQNLSIDPKNKLIIFSDSLTVEKAIRLQRLCKEKGIGCAFGIGTNFTNDFNKITVDSHSTSATNINSLENKSKAMNIVIKLMTCNEVGCVKLSDDHGKYTGLPSDIDRALNELGLAE
ncbi:hypothetical protein BB561_001853 [Smittium simulii]|uniref:nicotinate phosphoribosyltransferase n=1 Tax=Smittium simulii TaxID=133385 RepID=A0A2T9YST4_9FUNG|nr:hypothetical protein BB561_001853 [Smittium simulii]